MMEKRKIIMHVDMDAFFAAIEELDHPDYRGKPVVVGADPKGGKGRGVVSTCNYEARKYGIHSAMPISQAYRLCPHAIYVFPRMRRYAEMSEKIRKIFYDFTPIVEPISIDEAFLDISGCIRLFGSAKKIAEDLKNKIKSETGLTASVGIAPSKFVAKIASDLKKPDGLVIVGANEVKEFLAPLPIAKMWGVGKKTEVKLKQMGITTIGKLAEMPQKLVVKKLGKAGLHFWYLANGIDDREVHTESGRKSVSLENTFHEDIADEATIEKMIRSLSDNVSRILRKKGIKGKTITLKIRLEDFSTFTRSKSFSEFIDESKTIASVALDLYRNFDRQDKKIRLLGVALSNLNTNIGEQLDIFEQERQKENEIDKIIDLVQNKFGADLIKKASLIDRHSRHIDFDERE